MSAATGRAGMLFDYAVEQPEGFTVPDACQHFEWSRSQFTRAVRALRLILGSDEINLVCEQQGFGQPKRWRLVGDVERAHPWIKSRIRAMESQLETVNSVAASVENATDGRTLDGKKARLVHRHVGRLLEDIGELEGRFPVTTPK